MEQKIETIFKFCRSNRTVYDLLRKKINSLNGVMPFIGYELISFNYGTKQDFLEFLIKYNHLDDCKDQLITADYLESLSRILNTLAYDALDYRELIEWSVFEDYYSVEKIDWFRVLYEPINLIQWFNDGSAITVNFDRVYEELNNGKHMDIATPFNKMLLHHFLRKDSALKSVVFKVHGDLFSNKREVILLEEEFTKAYQDPDFLNMLKMWINQYVLLFVGIDICKDRYLKPILHETKQEGITHFAIVGCEDDSEKKKELLTEYAKLQIKPILYDINKPDSIRIILHKLLVDSQNIKWKQSIKRGTLHYLYDDQLTLGRDTQIAELISFLDDERKFLFCTITSKSIIGKSKLAYEFAQTYAFKWRWYMIPSTQMVEFLNKHPTILNNMSHKQDTLIIFDDYSWYDGSLTNIYNYINKISKKCLKLRVIFISTDLKESNFMKPKSKEANDFFFSAKNIYKNFYLSVLDVEEIMEIAFQYVLFRQHEIGLEDIDVDSWKLEIGNSLRTYINEILVEYPHEALLFSMVYAVKLTLNYLDASTSESDNDYVYRETYKYMLTEGTGIDYYTDGIDRKKFQHNLLTRVNRIEKYYDKINKNREYIDNDTNIVYTDEQEFRNRFEQDNQSKNNVFGLGVEEE